MGKLRRFCELRPASAKRRRAATEASAKAGMMVAGRDAAIKKRKRADEAADAGSPLTRG
jgi:hypothetical protein